VSLANDDETPALASALPSRVAETRDALGNVCFVLHFAVMLYIVLGWAAPFRPALVFYVWFVPAVVATWPLNRCSCVLNNIESLIRTGRWRDPHNREEGAWLLNLAHNATGIAFKPWQIDALTYVAVAALWGVGLSHLLWW